MIHRHSHEAGGIDPTALLRRQESECTEVYLADLTGTLDRVDPTGDPADMIIVCLSGAADARADGRSFHLHRMSALYVPQGQEVYVRAEAGEPGRLVRYLYRAPRDTAPATGTVKQVLARSLDESRLFDFGANSGRPLVDQGETNGCEVVVVAWPAGNRGAMVAHKEKEQTFYVMEGTGSITVGSETVSVAPGDVVFVPRNTPHTTEAGAEVLTYLCFNSYILRGSFGSFEEMYQEVAPGRIERWKKGDTSVGR